MVKLTKVPEADVRALMHEIREFTEQMQEVIQNKPAINDLLDAITAVDIAFKLWVSFRTKTESMKDKFTITLRPSEAVILLKVCYKRSLNFDGSSTATACEKYKLEIDQQIKNLPTVSKKNSQKKNRKHQHLLHKVL